MFSSVLSVHAVVTSSQFAQNPYSIPLSLVLKTQKLRKTSKQLHKTTRKTTSNYTNYKKEKHYEQATKKYLMLQPTTKELQEVTTDYNKLQKTTEWGCYLIRVCLRSSFNTREFNSRALFWFFGHGKKSLGAFLAKIGGNSS